MDHLAVLRGRPLRLVSHGAPAPAGGQHPHGCLRHPLPLPPQQPGAGNCPRCDCGGIVKPEIVFYGEQLDQDLLEQAFNDFASADLAIVLGSSLTVNPAALLPQYTLRGGGKLAIINGQPTGLDQYATWRFSDLGASFEKLAELGK